jgi:hypothetical protein
LTVHYGYDIFDIENYLLSNGGNEESVGMDRLLTPDQVAEFLAVSKKTVYRIIKEWIES